MAEETAIGKPLEVYVSKTEAELLAGEPNVLGLSSDQNTIVFNNKVIGSGAGIRYKTIRLSASSGWIRFAQHKIDATTNATAIFGIERGYGSKKDEHYVFASSLNHAENGYITQLSGSYLDNSAHFIKKVRSAQKKGDTKPFYLDFYIESSSVEPYYVWILGNWELLDITRVDEEQDTANNITRFVEFETTNGFATSGDVKATDFIGNVPDTAIFSKELTALNSLQSPRLRSLNSQIRNNLLSFNGSALTAEYTIDGGDTWVDFGLTDTQKNQFVTDGWELTNQLKAGNGDTTVTPQLKGVRLTYDFSAIANGTFNGNISDAIFTTKANNGTVMKVEVLDWKNNVWTEKGTYNLYSSDALPNAVYLGTLGFRKAAITTENQYKAIRFTFSYQGTYTELTRIPFNVRSLKLFSNGWYDNTLPNYACYGHLYSTDSSQNMIIPNHLLPETTLANNLGASSKSFQNVFTRFIDTPTSYNLQFKASGTSRWQVSSSSGNFLPVTDSKLNIGSESLKVKEIYAKRLVGVADKAAADEDNNKIKSTYFSNATAKGNVLTLSRPDGSSKSVTIAVSSEDGSDIEMPKAVSVPIFDGFKTSAVESVEGANSWRRIVFVVSQGKFMAEYGDLVSLKYTSAFNNEDNDNPIKDTDYQDENGVLLNKVFKLRDNNALYVFNVGENNLQEVNRQLSLELMIRGGELQIRTNRPLLATEKVYLMRKGRYSKTQKEDNERLYMLCKGWRRYQPYPKGNDLNDSYITPYSDNSLSVDYYDTPHYTSKRDDMYAAKYWVYSVNVTEYDFVKEFGAVKKVEGDTWLKIRNGLSPRLLNTQSDALRRIRLSYGIAVYSKTYNLNSAERFVAIQEERVSNIAEFKLEIRNWQGVPNNRKYMNVPNDVRQDDTIWLGGYVNFSV